MRRPPSRTAPPVPVVLPFVQVWIGPGGKLTILVDREPYEIPANVVPAGRPALGRVLDEIISRLGSPVRIELHEVDGAVFTDILTPRPAPTSAPPDRISAGEPVPQVQGESPEGGGLVPGERVAVAIVVSYATADTSGVADIRLPAALMTKHRGVIVLVGRTSGAVAFADAVGSQGVA